MRPILLVSLSTALVLAPSQHPIAATGSSQLQANDRVEFRIKRHDIPGQESPGGIAKTVLLPHEILLCYSHGVCREGCGIPSACSCRAEAADTAQRLDLMAELRVVASMEVATDGGSRPIALVARPISRLPSD